MLKRGETPPEHLANSLYVEWYSARSGRLVIESADYRLEISEPEWRFSAEEMSEWKRRAADSESPFAASIDSAGEEEVWDEFRCEQLLRESELTGDQYRRLLEKYADHPDGDRIIAREMGWSWPDELPPEPERDALAEVDDEKPNDDFDSESEPPLHPIAQRARDLLEPWLAGLKAHPEFNRGAMGEWIAQLMTLRVKLSAHLSFLVRETTPPDPALLIAWLKRDLELTHQALASLEALNGHPEFPVARWDQNRAELFVIREAILKLIAELRS